MGILDLINTVLRALIVTKANYDKCNSDRRVRLEAFRKRAKAYLTFKYPQSIILMINHFPLFLLYDKQSGQVHQGEFADHYSPFLEFVPYDGALEDLKHSIQ